MRKSRMEWEKYYAMESEDELENSGEVNHYEIEYYESMNSDYIRENKLFKWKKQLINWSEK